MAGTAEERIFTLDVIRGIAVMGILSVNIVGMAMIEDAYFFPTLYGFHSAADKVMWALNSIFVDGRFRALFSILFGASMTVIVTRADEAGKKDWQVHYPRMIVLLLFGCVHYYLLWWGDILVNYALIGMVAFLFWRLKPSLLLLAAACSLILFYVPQWAAAAPQIEMVQRGEQAGAPAALHAQAEAMLKRVTPSETPADIKRDKRDHDSLHAHLQASTQGDALLDPWLSVTSYGLETLGFMLIGIAALKAGFLTGAWSRASYAVTAAACLGIDWLVHVWAAYLCIRDGFAPLTFIPWTRLYVSPLYAVGAIGYAALIMLVLGRRSAISERVAAVGRAAFTNYLGSTIVGVLVFYGMFGGLYGQLSRAEVWLFVPPMWAFMLIWSKPWLDRYNYGPMEWAWRSLSRWHLQAMRKGVQAPVLAGA